ncbi:MULTISPECIES: DUF255 domain-containing protein [unclassified Microcoleus]|uniref:DUF255 domain-containing protein n=1 Tax=unclassified Microcoleus TaxID=2642155 RepID=UPI002FD3DD43
MTSLASKSENTPKIRSTFRPGATKPEKGPGGKINRFLLSIRYSSCHWFRVMECEGFCDRAIVQYLNSHLIPIKSAFHCPACFFYRHS